jgi:hypothetical protein
MSGKQQYHKYTKAKKPAGSENAGLLDKEVKTRKARSYKDGSSSSSGLCVKTVFFMLLSTFTLVATLVYLDYQPGQLKEAYDSQVPPEVS